MPLGDILLVSYAIVAAGRGDAIDDTIRHSARLVDDDGVDVRVGVRNNGLDDGNDDNDKDLRTGDDATDVDDLLLIST
jgi:hypothetical protein